MYDFLGRKKVVSTRSKYLYLVSMIPVQHNKQKNKEKIEKISIVSIMK